MKYITCKHYDRHGVIIHKGAECDEVDGVIVYKGKQICSVKSRVAHQYFANNDDGNGMERWKLAMAIETAMIENAHKDNIEMSDDVVSQIEVASISSAQDADGEQDDAQDGIVEFMMDDALCSSYRREDVRDVWLWNHDFYSAPISDLKKIADLIVEKSE